MTISGSELKKLVDSRINFIAKKLEISENEIYEKLPHLKNPEVFADFSVKKAENAEKIPEINRFVDHTLLKSVATEKDIEKIVEEANKYDFFSVCVNSCFAGQVSASTEPSVATTCVVGFPLGCMETSAKAFETSAAIKNGADEIDMVQNNGMILGGDMKAALKDISAVIDVCHFENSKIVLKNILECCAGDMSLTVDGCILTALACKKGFEKQTFVKTSTGFSTFGATPEHVAVMAAIVCPIGMQVKAAGGVRSYDDAVEMIINGATRLGCSSGVQIMNGAVAASSY